MLQTASAEGDAKQKGRPAMRYAPLGRSGLVVSRLALGCMSFAVQGEGRHRWTIDEDASRHIIRQALGAGVNFFDTANEYGAGTSEEIVGRALNDFASRDEIVLATKVYSSWRDAPNTGGLSRKALLHAIDDSLRRLGTDYIDLWQIHRFDHVTPVEETMASLHDIVQSGKVRYLGASSMWAWEFAKLQHCADRAGTTRFVSMQPQLSLVYREEQREMIPLCKDIGVGVVPWSPLARGMLARPWGRTTARGETDVFSKHLFAASQASDRAVVKAVEAVAKARGKPMSQIALAWVMQVSGVTAPIVGATCAAHLDDAVQALDLTLDADEIATLEAPYQPRAVAGLASTGSVGGTITVRN